MAPISQSTPMRFLITGFESFYKVPVNPTQKLMEEVSSWIPREFDKENIQIQTHVLPVSFEKSIHKLDHLIRIYQPDIIIETGAHGGNNEILLERRAQNLNHSKIADNDGDIRTNHTILAEKTFYLYGNLCWKEIRSRLDSVDVRHADSYDAGSFVCNHLYYWTLATHPDKCVGFLHFPVDLYSSEGTEALHQMACICMQNLLQVLLDWQVKKHLKP